jgi:dihydropteroate synthase
MEFFQIDLKDQNQAFDYFTRLGSDQAGAKIMSEKSHTYALYIKDLKVAAANILKQDALSIGADLAVPVGTIMAKEPFVDAILIGTAKHFKLLSKKELSQPFGLKELAKKLQSFLLKQSKPTQIMGIINANDDSFFEKSRFKDTQAIEKIYTMIDDGADIIDIGGVSTRPGSDEVSQEEELKRIKPICDLIKKEKLYEKTILSIDSFTPSVIEYALKSGFHIVNDITGLQDNKVCQLVAQYNAQVVIMHMQGKPKDMQHNPSYENVLIEVDQFFKDRIKKAHSYGIENIILDVGIGFGKTLKHNLTLLKNHEHFLHFGYPLLMGASRKSLIDKITPTPTEQRLPGTLAIHLHSIQKGASIIRCHDVKEHFQAIQVQNSISSDFF